MKYSSEANNKPECISNETHCKRAELIKAVTAKINDPGIDEYTPTSSPSANCQTGGKVDSGGKHIFFTTGKGGLWGWGKTCIFSMRGKYFVIKTGGKVDSGGKTFFFFKTGKWILWGNVAYFGFLGEKAGGGGGMAEKVGLTWNLHSNVLMDVFKCWCAKIEKTFHTGKTPPHCGYHRY